MTQSFPLVALLVASLMAAAVPSMAQSGDPAGLPLYSIADEQTLRFDLAFAQPSPDADGEFDLPAPQGFSPASIPGMRLPAFSAELGVRVTGISIEAVDVVEIDRLDVGLVGVEDLPFPQQRSGNSPAVSMSRQSNPTQWAAASDPITIGDLDLTSLTVYPYRYDHSRDVVLWARRLVVRVGVAKGSNLHAAGDVARLFATASRRKPLQSLSIKAEQLSTAVTAPDGFEYKLVTGTDGLYRASARDLLAVGLPLDRIDVRTLKLFSDGIEVPVYIGDRGDHQLQVDSREDEYIEFYAERPRARNVEHGSDLHYDSYSAHATFFLSWGGSPGKRLVEETGDPRQRDGSDWVDLTPATSSFRSTVHLEENQTAAINFNANLNRLSDRFDRMMWQHIAANAQINIPVTFPTPDVVSDGPIRLTVALRGSSAKGEARSETEKKNHAAEIFFQNRRALLVEFTGDDLAFASSDSNRVGTLSSSMLPAESEGTISIINRSDGSKPAGSSISLNWIELTYPRLYKAYRNRLDFSIPDGMGRRYFRFRLRGFTSPDIRIYRKGISRVANVAVVQQSESPGSDRPLYDAIFQVYAASSAEQFVAVTGESLPRPILLRDTSARLLDSRNAADYIVITDELASDPGGLSDSKNPLRRFVELKREQGYTPRIVRAVDIYDEFSGGRTSPEAIRSFLAYAWRNWATPPRYALIVGNGTPMKREALEAYLGEVPDSILSYRMELGYVPTIFFQTVDFGATPCDYLLGCFGDLSPAAGTTAVKEVTDFFPEVIVGRVNVLAPADVSAYFDKLIDQEKSPRDGLWRQTSEFIGGNSATFTKQIDRLIDRHYRSISEPHRIYTLPSFAGSAYGDPDRLLDVLRQPGAALVTYMGHGGGGQWEDVALLNSGNTFQMQNAGRMGTVLSYTCFTGAYDARSGLLSAMMIQPNSGAISALGTAGLGWQNNNGLLAEAISSVIANPRYGSLSFGEIVALGKARYIGINQRSYPDQVPTVAAMFSIFGDPSLGIPLARDTVRLVPATAAVVPGRTMRATTRLPFTPTSLTLSLFDSSEVAFSSRLISGATAGSAVVLEGDVPAGYRGSYAGMRIHASSADGRRVTGSIRFATSDGAIVQVEPVGRLYAGSPASFELRLSGSNAPDSVSVALDHAGIYRFTGKKLALQRVGEGVYRSDSVGAGFVQPGARLTVQVAVPRSIDGITTFSFLTEGGPDPAAFAPVASDTARVRYGSRPELSAAGHTAESMRIVPGADGPRLSAMLYNWGDMEARDLVWSIDVDSASSAVALASGKVTIPANDSVRVEHRLTSHIPAEQRLTLSVQPTSGDHWKDAYRHNNSARATRTLAAGQYRSASGFLGGSFEFAPAGSMTLASPGNLAEGIVTATLIAERPSSAQPWSFIDIGDGRLSGGAIRLRTEPAAEPTVLITLVADTSRGVARGARIVRYNPATRLWIACETVQAPSGTGVTATVPADGIYALALSDDRVGPEVRFSVEGQFYSDSLVVPVDARFSAVISDPAGIDTDPRHLRVKLDGVELQAGTDYVLLDSSVTATTTNVRLQKSYTAGRHTLELEAVDRLGNRSIGQTIFQVETDLALVVHGNFPNPFASETFLAYEIRGANNVDELELMIFSTAGKPVRTFRYPASQPYEFEGLLQAGASATPTSLGYHEAWWNGLDNLGNQVANGVYFYRLRIRMGDEEVEQLGTMARVR